MDYTNFSKAVATVLSGGLLLAMLYVTLGQSTETESALADLAKPAIGMATVGFLGLATAAGLALHTLARLTTLRVAMRAHSSKRFSWAMCSTKAQEILDATKDDGYDAHNVRDKLRNIDHPDALVVELLMGNQEEALRWGSEHHAAGLLASQMSIVSFSALLLVPLRHGSHLEEMTLGTSVGVSAGLLLLTYLLLAYSTYMLLHAYACASVGRLNPNAQRSSSPTNTEDSKQA